MLICMWNVKSHKNMDFQKKILGLRLQVLMQKQSTSEGSKGPIFRIPLKQCWFRYFFLYQNLLNWSSSTSVGQLIPLFWWCLPWVLKLEWILCVLSCPCDPQIHLWCDTCRLQRGQHGSRTFSKLNEDSSEGFLQIPFLVACSVNNAWNTTTELLVRCW